MLVADGIAKISEGNCIASNNATKFSFTTGTSDAATKKCQSLLLALFLFQVLVEPTQM
jgi:hypothetical protein